MSKDRENLRRAIEEYAHVAIILEKNRKDAEQAQRTLSIARSHAAEKWKAVVAELDKAEAEQQTPVPPQVPCSVCKYWYIGHCNLKGVDIDGTHPHCDKLEFPIPKAETPTEDGPEVSCLECKHAERVDVATNTWRCTKGCIFKGFGKAPCREFEQVDKTSEKPRFCGSCKYCKQSDKDPDGVECTLTRTEFLPIVRWSTACPDFEEAQP